MRYFLVLVLITVCQYAFAQSTTVSGTLSDQSTGEALIFASVYVKGTSIGVTTNEYGFFSITVPHTEIDGEEFIVAASYLGYDTQEFAVPKVDSYRLDPKLAVETETFEAAEVVASKTKQEEELNSTQMSAVSIPMKEIANIPSIGGETDIIKVMQLLPGVQKGGEGGTGMFVRGGDADQNLVLLDEATVYNIGHLFGFFSVFNSDAINEMTMIKGAFPAQYGGRLSSIMDIRMKEGHMNEFHGKGGIGLLSSRIAIEAPIIKDRASFLISGRRTYIDQVFKAVGQELPYYFYDLNAKVNYKVDDRNRLYFSNYLGDDVLAFDGSDEESEDLFGFGFRLGNLTNTLRWNRLINDQVFSNISLIHTKFSYDINGRFNSNNILIQSDVRDIGVKADVDYYRSSREHIKFGGAVIEHIFKPNVVSTAGDISEFLASSEGENLNNLEFGFYGWDELSFLEGVYKLNFGLRVSGSLVENKTYVGIEPRVAMKYSLNEYDVVKASYSRMNQYMHRVSSSSVALPTDLWYPVTSKIRPQNSDQIAVGYSHLFKSISTTLSIEGYYKWLNNLIEYREGANLILNDNFEAELLQGKGDAWGGELLLRKEEGRFTGWVAYTLSWSTRDFEELNNGETFWAKYDRRHVISLVGSFKLSDRWDFSAVWVYSSGSRFTAQVGQYFVPNSSLTGIEIIPLYTDRNEVSMSPSHRLDVNFVLGPRPGKDKRFKSEWHFGGYNVYNRATPYRINVEPTDDGLGYQYVQPGLFGFIPSVAYNFSF